MADNIITLEDFVASDPALILGMMIAPTEVLGIAAEIGIRKSEDAEMQKMLDRAVRIIEFGRLPWVQEKLSLETNLEEKVRAMIDHGVTKSPCCLGTNPNCQIQQEMDRQLSGGK